MKNRHRGRRKAAILLASLDRPSADALLAQVSPEHAEALRDALASLGEIDPDEQCDVLEEFFRIGPLVPDREPSGLEPDDPAAVQLSLSAPATAASSAADASAPPARDE